MNILLASAEASPFAKTGGLADMAHSFPIEWNNKGHEAIVFIPKYQQIDVNKWKFKPTNIILKVPMGYWTEYSRLWSGFFPNTNTRVYLIENDEYFGRPGIYGNPNEYEDNDRRFIFLSRAIFEASKAISFKPDIIHAHDFHTAFALAFLKSQYKNDPHFSSTAGVITIHNIAYQGWFKPERAMEYAQFGMNQFYPGSWFEHKGMVNALKTGIMFADKITTVSPTYSHEIRLPYFSEGLQDVLNLRGADLVGILNGVFYSEWSPETDENLYFKYNHESLELKRANKHKFLNEFGIDKTQNPDLPLIGLVSRLTEQKGIDLLMDKLENWIKNGIARFAILGSGEQKYIDYFDYLASKYPGKIIVYIGYNNALSHKIVGCSDFILLPSRFEPCGLTQMYALKYGTIPIVRQVGGLHDTVFEFNKSNITGNGFSFWHYNADDMDFAVSRALNIYSKEPEWTYIRKNAMSADFSSEKSALEYLKVFKWALESIK